VCQDLPLVLHLACEEGLRSIDGRERASSNCEAMFWTHRTERYQSLLRHMEERHSDPPGTDGEVCGG
jgi:Zn-finger protein